jgi:hypothetical protein
VTDPIAVESATYHPVLVTLRERRPQGLSESRRIGASPKSGNRDRNRDRHTKKYLSLFTAQQISRLQRRSLARNNPMVLIDRTFRCHQSAKMTWPIGGACRPPIRDIHSPKGRSQAGGSTDQPPHRPSTNKQKSPRPDQAERGSEPRRPSPNPEEKVRWCFGSLAQMHRGGDGHVARLRFLR